LPPSLKVRASAGKTARGPGFIDGLRIHLRDPGLPWLFALPFLLMGCFVSLYNYIGYRLLAPPFGLRQSAVGLLSLLYLLGIFSSMWAGRLGCSRRWKDMPLPERFYLTRTHLKVVLSCFALSACPGVKFISQRLMVTYSSSYHVIIYLWLEQQFPSNGSDLYSSAHLYICWVAAHIRARTRGLAQEGGGRIGGGSTPANPNEPVYHNAEEPTRPRGSAALDELGPNTAGEACSVRQFWRGLIVRWLPPPPVSITERRGAKMR
jgi:hypothetical protein